MSMENNLTVGGGAGAHPNVTLRKNLGRGGEEEEHRADESKRSLDSTMWVPAGRPQILPIDNFSGEPWEDVDEFIDGVEDALNYNNAPKILFFTKLPLIW